LPQSTSPLAFAAGRRAAVDMDRKAAADAPCSNRSISPADSSKPAARRSSGRMGQTEKLFMRALTPAAPD